MNKESATLEGALRQITEIKDDYESLDVKLQMRVGYIYTPQEVGYIAKEGL